MDSDTFDELYRATSRRLLQYAYAMCPDLGMAQDITQEAYIRAWPRWQQVRDYDHPTILVTDPGTGLCSVPPRRHRYGCWSLFDSMGEFENLHTYASVHE